jgi:hypothetical protein
MEDITAVPLSPTPIIPMRTAEFALVPKTVPGFKIIIEEIAAALLRNILRSITL